MRQLTTVRRQPGWQVQDPADADAFDDDLFVDGDERRRQRMLSIGAVKPERLDDMPRIARAAQPAVTTSAARRAGHRQSPAWMWALLGFVVGIGFWHAIGFWGFISDVVLPPIKATQGQLSSEPAGAAQNPVAPAYHVARPTRSRP